MTRPVTMLAVQLVAVTVILASLLALAARHPWRLDLTPERRFTLSPYTREILGRLTADVRITVFYSSQADAMRREMADLLALYRDAEPRITVRFLDLDRSPGMAKRLGASAYNTAVVEVGGRREPVTLVTEEALTAALLTAAGTPPVVTYFVVGHGERDPGDGDEREGASDAARALGAEGFHVRRLEGAAALPADAALLVLAGPRRELSPAELGALARYVANGGRLLVLADPESPAGLRGWLRGYGVELAGDVVVDEQGRLFGTDGLSARVAYVNQRLVPRTPEVQALLPEAQSLRVTEAAGAHAEYLATTAEGTWADVGRDALTTGTAVFRPDTDRRGPLPVAALARVAGDDGPQGRVVVIGDADFVTNLHLGVLGNRDLLLLAVNLLARRDPVAAARPPTPPGGTFSPVTLTAREARIVFWGAVVAPGALLGVAALVMARRRRAA